MCASRGTLLLMATVRNKVCQQCPQQPRQVMCHVPCALRGATSGSVGQREERQTSLGESLWCFLSSKLSCTAISDFAHTRILKGSVHTFAQRSHM